MSMSATTDLEGPIYFFGDSLTDDGNLSPPPGLVSDEALDAYVGAGGRISDGPTYAEHVDDILGLPESGNYAMAGAEAAGRQRLGDFIDEFSGGGQLLVSETDPRLDLDINLGAQIDRFAADASGAAPEDATGFILIGANDFLNIVGGADPAVVVPAAVAATLSGATDLLGLGLDDAVIATLPVPRFFPALGELSPEQLDQVEAISDAFAAGLAQGVGALRLLGQDVRLLDMRPISEAILDDPSGFGLIAPYGLTLKGGDQDELARYDRDQVAFWNPLHPSAATHGVLGAYTAFALEHDPIGLTADADHEAAGAGADLVLGLGGGDAIGLGAGSDLGFGGSGEDTILAGRGNDLASGGSQDDLLKGQRGKDVLDGDEGSDQLSGGRAGDVLIDGLGSDLARGGAGADRFLFTEAELVGGTTGEDEDLLIGGKGTDTLWLALGRSTLRSLGDELTEADPQEALADLGIEVRGIEEIRVVAGRAGFEALSHDAWFQPADLWGLV
ncbi:hypothetical protein Rumeso_01129 [Rubellimicrobium mesophilum DSM 19309]|uniref:Uncharacterized protein n=1 Tax=Rubellimicrobium mesophilum DSM 19309 TaxID=442562 RepID=A0A017HU58_9RHOB|nr:SGNH/GDSL hydrolase family protein [Rubellimicrobium mesophilum]EYD77289.1 hypothetical protein Rumeso_01129 [Rubellimicrobium mesophilum DSM 19309]